MNTPILIIHGIQRGMVVSTNIEDIEVYEQKTSLSWNDVDENTMITDIAKMQELLEQDINKA